MDAEAERLFRQWWDENFASILPLDERQKTLARRIWMAGYSKGRRT